jgi:spermidine synthase
VNVPSFGDWGFVLARSDTKPALELDPPRPLRFLDEANLAAAAVFPVDRRPTGVEPPSTLDDPRIVRLTTAEWQQY